MDLNFDFFFLCVKVKKIGLHAIGLAVKDLEAVSSSIIIGWFFLSKVILIHLSSHTGIYFQIRFKCNMCTLFSDHKIAQVHYVRFLFPNLVSLESVKLNHVESFILLFETFAKQGWLTMK